MARWWGGTHPTVAKLATRDIESPFDRPKVSTFLCRQVLIEIWESALGFDDEISRVELLLSSGEDRALLYAALECRLVLEVIAFQRLESSMSKTSRKLYDWRPRQVLEALAKEVGDSVLQHLRFSIAVDAPENCPATAEDFEKLDWIEIGAQTHLNVQALNRHWHALSSFLHHSDKKVDATQEIKRKEKIQKALDFIREVNRGTLLMGPLSGAISFKCECGAEIKRNEDRLHEKQLVACNNPECNESYLVKKDDNGWISERRVTQGNCNVCNHTMIIPALFFDRLRGNQFLSFNCSNCGEKTVGVLARSLQQAAKPK